jgi:hypothetical protein
MECVAMVKNGGAYKEVEDEDEQGQPPVINSRGWPRQRRWLGFHATLDFNTGQ